MSQKNIDYHSMCKIENIKPISESTCYKILKNCPALFRRSMQGLDNIVANGFNSFDEMDKMVSKLSDNGLNLEKVKTFQIVLSDTRNYLKFFYKKNLNFSKECANHCIAFSLSEKNICIHNPCP